MGYVLPHVDVRHSAGDELRDPRRVKCTLERGLRDLLRLPGRLLEGPGVAEMLLYVGVDALQRLDRGGVVGVVKRRELDRAEVGELGLVVEATTSRVATEGRDGGDEGTLRGVEVGAGAVVSTGAR